MIKENLTFKLTSNPDVANKIIDNKQVDLISVPMLTEEIQMLCENNTLLSALKINNMPQKLTTYVFTANVDNQEYDNHKVSSVTVVVDNSNIDININNISILNKYINEVKDLTEYKTCDDFFQLGMAKGKIIQGYSIGTYSTSKYTKEFTVSTSQSREPVDWTSYIIYDDNNDYSDEGTNVGKPYVLKG